MPDLHEGVGGAKHPWPTAAQSSQWSWLFDFLAPTSNLTNLDMPHRNPVSCRDSRAANLARFAKQRMPKGAPKLFLEAWELRPSEVHLVRPCLRPNHAETAASAGHDLVCIQGDSRQTHNVKAGFRKSVLHLSYVYSPVDVQCPSSGTCQPDSVWSCCPRCCSAS